MATLNVGAGQAYATLAAAVAASHDGDVVAVQTGTYVNDFATISTKISIVGVGGMANFVATAAPPNGKGILVTQTDVTIQNLSFSGAAVADANGAGIRYEGGNLVVIDSYFHDNQDGILANADPDGTIRIVGSEFANNGAGDGFSHNIYVGDIASLIIDDSYFHDADTGHQIKSRAQSTTITNSRIYDGTGTGSYSIDLPNGGVAVIRDNVIEQGPNSPNTAIIHYGGESAAYAGSSITIVDNVVVNDLADRPSTRLLANATTVTATISGNDVYGLTSDQIASGLASVSGTIYLSARPSLDTSAPWLDTGSDTIFGTAGADKLMGTAGADTMAGLAGADVLKGYGGADLMDGGADGDVYYVDASDIIHDTGVSGTDKVRSDGSYVLAAGSGIEQLTTESGVVGGNLTGDEGANIVTGNTGANILRGKAGNDTLFGGAGTDTLVGGADRDRMTGGVDADIFRFARDSRATTIGYDTVQDFETGIDRIDLRIFNDIPLSSDYAEIVVASDSFTTLKSAAEAQLVGGVEAVFVTGVSHGWLFWNTDATPGTAEGGVLLTGHNSLNNFSGGDLF